ncbi:MAG: hypothetical protein DHS20C18_52910 [Saprospiraceae bacterium]|nr:MAG: hypothetical protein DHS20C18_52910 [Saprospiraceae bacterium]
MEEGFKLKEIINQEMVANIAADIHAAWSDFDREAFERAVLAKLKPLSFSERANLIMEKMAVYLPTDYPKALAILTKSFGPETKVQEPGNYDSFYYWPHANFVAHYGLEYFDLSMQALYEITKRFTSEFPIRAFISKYPEKTMHLLHRWVKDDNEHVRRLVSEGTRPRLPWASRLPQFQEDPQPVIDLLEKLKEDPELYVRRSVANNLNDIGKDNPELVVKVLTRWSKINNEGTQWIIKHAARSLIKAGHTEVLSLLGYPPNVKLVLRDFSTDTKVRQGEKMSFSFSITSRENQPVNLMIDYLIHFMKANGQQSAKVFKLSKKTIAPGETLAFTKNQSFKPISTRVYYPGVHAVEVQVNGKILGKQTFLLV